MRRMDSASIASLPTKKLITFKNMSSTASISSNVEIEGNDAVEVGDLVPEPRRLLLLLMFSSYVKVDSKSFPCSVDTCSTIDCIIRFILHLLTNTLCLDVYCKMFLSVYISIRLFEICSQRCRFSQISF